MKIKNFSNYLLTENSDLDWSDKNWDERGMSAENPPNSGFEGTSSEPMDYFGGDYGETADSESELINGATSLKIAASELKLIVDLAKDISNRLNTVEQKCKRYAKSK
ncbi:hypothetical protein UFOVP699_99 [uncultured Caudovirales phage]|uniref:Uncharacterized protein n=1 Tax=uncultured Caudovirales phage TaxID=2100421 RepID=A0A6J5NHW7_9CAUD|nr:hypothetical protein UFOVP699_99 [uncultured Caudovirales phage]